MFEHIGGKFAEAIPAEVRRDAAKQRSVTSFARPTISKI